MKVSLSEIEDLPEVNIRQSIRPDAVERYSEILDSMPPISLTRVEPDRLILTDGKHRIAAARRLGREEIEAHVSDGTLQQAVIDAATANAKHGVPWDRQEQRQAILHLWQSDHAKTNRRTWTYNTIAKAVGAKPAKVEEIVRALKVKETIRDVTGSLNDGQLVAIGRAPEDARPALAEMASTEGWTVQQTRDAAKGVYRDGDGEVRINLAALQKGANEEARNDPLAALYGALKALAWLKARWEPDATTELDAEERRRIDGDLEAYALLLRKVQDSLTARV